MQKARKLHQQKWYCSKAYVRQGSNSMRQQKKFGENLEKIDGDWRIKNLRTGKFCTECCPFRFIFQFQFRKLENLVRQRKSLSKTEAFEKVQAKNWCDSVRRCTTWGPISTIQSSQRFSLYQCTLYLPRHIQQVEPLRHTPRQAHTLEASTHTKVHNSPNPTQT